MDRRERVRDCAATIAMLPAKQKREGIFVRYDPFDTSASNTCWRTVDANGIAKTRNSPLPRENAARKLNQIRRN
jgi:hypothetical protein